MCVMVPFVFDKFFSRFDNYRCPMFPDLILSPTVFTMILNLYKYNETTISLLSGKLIIMRNVLKEMQYVEITKAWEHPRRKIFKIILRNAM